MFYKKYKLNMTNIYKRKIIPYSRHFIDKNDINSVVNVLKSDFLTTGPTVKIFEKKISKFCGSKFSICVSNASAGLHLACLALGLTKKDIVWTSGITFVSSINSALHCNSKIDLVDIDKDDFNMSIKNLKEKLKIAKILKKLPKVLIVVHLGGVSCKMKEIYELSKKYKFKIIEDASHAFGSKYDGKYVGNCKYSEMAIFSFHPVKTFTTGEGGVVTTNNSDIAKKIYSLREHGLIRDKKKFSDKNQGTWYYEQQNLGFNYRMSDIHAALGVSQLKKLKKFVKRRNEIAKIYKKELNNYPIKFQNLNNNLSSYHLLIVKFPKVYHHKMFDLFRNKNIKVNIHYIPLYMHPFFKFNKKKYSNNLKNSQEYYDTAISLPNYFHITNKEIYYVINIIKKFFNKKNKIISIK